MILMDCLGVLATASPDGLVPTLGQFRSGLSGPVRDLLPAGSGVGVVGDTVLLEPSGDLAPEVEDILQEHFVECTALDQHWSHRRVRAEQEEKRLYQDLRALGLGATQTPSPCFGATIRRRFIARPVGVMGNILAEGRCVRSAWRTSSC